jgi:predicted transcriptional regulator
MNGQKAVLMSIRPEWLWKILDGRKTIEVRKTIPAIEPPFRVYLYCTKGGDELWTEDKCGALPRGSFGSWKMNGTVCAEFVCDKIYQIAVKRGEGMIMLDGEKEIPFTNDNEMRLTKWDLHKYLSGKTGYGWHITELRTFEKPLSYADFSLIGRGYFHSARPPQSWCYVEEL